MPARRCIQTGLVVFLILRAGPAALPEGAEADVCVRPERVLLIRPDRVSVDAAHDTVVTGTIAEEVKTFTARLDSPEAKEAMSAFLEKRKPDFSRF